MEKFLPGEPKQDRKSASREAILSLPDVKLPELGSPDDVTMRAMQEEGRSLCGGLVAIWRAVVLTLCWITLLQHNAWHACRMKLAIIAWKFFGMPTRYRCVWSTRAQFWGPTASV